MLGPGQFARPGTLVIHPGPHKTGTTAIQKTLMENRDYLRGLGIFYPDIGFSYFGHHQLVGSLDRGDRAALSLARDELQRLSHHTVVLSSENLSRSPPDAIARLAQLAEGFESVHIVFYLRNFLQLFYAWWQELVKHRLTDEFCYFLAGCLVQPYSTHLLDAAGMVHRFAKVFGADRIAVFLYEEVMRTHGDTAHHFMTEVLGVPGYAPQPGIKGINGSLDPIAIEIVRSLNRVGAHGVQVLQQNPAVRQLRAAMRPLAESYTKTVTLGYQQFLPHRLERGLLDALRDLEIPVRLHGGDEWDFHTALLFEERKRDIRYLDPAIWLLEPEIASLMRELLAQQKVSLPNT